jgi:multidrug efflux pump subunit AcrA (membrane-fusion protein)
VVFGVKLEIDEPDDRLKPGMSASVKILTSEVKNALVVPTNALIEEEDGTYVDVVVDEETFETERKKVEIKVKDNTHAVVEKGLKEGDVVVVSSIDFTMDEEEGDEFDSDMMEDDSVESFEEDVELEDGVELEDDVELEDAEEFEA